jgi:signal peptidase I
MEEREEIAQGRVAPASVGKSVLREYAEALIIAILLALVIRAFVVQAFKIPSGSMLPTLQIGDHILVNKFIYYFEPIRRGDVIVFKYPQDESRDFIKRVIGLPGETLEIRGRQVLINGVPLKEPYAVYADRSSSPILERVHVDPFVIPPGKLFMMGDNRDNSMDSRVWGLLDMHKIKGKAFIVYFSIRSEDIPFEAILPGFLYRNVPYLGPVLDGTLYVITHPSIIRWGRLGTMVH